MELLKTILQDYMSIVVPVRGAWSCITYRWRSMQEYTGLETMVPGKQGLGRMEEGLGYRLTPHLEYYCATTGVRLT